MDLDILLDNYKNSSIRKRLIFCIIVGLLPSIYTLINDYDELLLEKESAVEATEISRLKYDKNKKKVASLSDLESKVNAIETGLNKAKRLLPNEISMDKILSALGQMERDLEVKLKSFTPAEKFEDNSALGYSSIPVKLSLEGDFSETMKYLDQLVHMDSLTHLRNISFSNGNEETKEGGDGNDQGQVTEEKKDDTKYDEENRVVSSVDLIIYKGL